MTNLFLTIVLLCTISFSNLNDGFHEVTTVNQKKDLLLIKSDSLKMKCAFDIKTTLKTEKGKEVHIELKVKADKCEDAKEVLKNIISSTLTEKSKK